MNRILFCGVLLVPSIYMVACPAELQGAPTSFWNTVEDHLEHGDLKGFALADFLAVKDANELYRRDDLDVYWEMIAQVNYPLVQLAGLEFLKDRSPGSAVDAAEFLVLSPDHKWSALSVIEVKFLQNKKNAPEVVAHLSELARRFPSSETYWYLLVNDLPFDAMYNWFRDHGNEPMSASYLAGILDELITNGKDNKLPPTKQMYDAVNRFRDLEGTPRAVYVLDGDEHAPTFAETMAAVLQDQTLSEGVRGIVVSRRRDYILQHIDWRNLGLSAQIRTYLEKQSHNK